MVLYEVEFADKMKWFGKVYGATVSDLEEWLEIARSGKLYDHIPAAEQEEAATFIRERCAGAQIVEVEQGFLHYDLGGMIVANLDDKCRPYKGAIQVTPEVRLIIALDYVPDFRGYQRELEEDPVGNLRRVRMKDGYRVLDHFIPVEVYHALKACDVSLLEEQAAAHIGRANATIVTVSREVKRETGMRIGSLPKPKYDTEIN